MNTEEIYQGFEQGPIRPPSEACSLLLRVTRNCPWNHCTFCSLYKGEKFSIRPVAHVKQDIDAVGRSVDRIRAASDPAGVASRQTMMALFTETPQGEGAAFQAARHWLQGGMASIFLQDVDSLILKPGDLVEILAYVRARFPRVEGITSYARSHTIARISDLDMKRLAAAGLNRIHIGMESAADEVLGFVKKGVAKQTHIKAGQRVKGPESSCLSILCPGWGAWPIPVPMSWKPPMP